jgi:hypothetical protein
LPTVEATDANTTADQHAALERSNLAIANLTMAFQTESLMSLMYKAESTRWPISRAYIVIDLLFKKYKPSKKIAFLNLCNRTV